MVCDSVTLINKLVESKQANILVEGAQSCMLDIDFGTYPHVTSSNCSVGGVCTGLGLSPSRVGPVYGVIKGKIACFSPVFIFKSHSFHIFHCNCFFRCLLFDSNLTLTQLSVNSVSFFIVEAVYQ